MPDMDKELEAMGSILAVLTALTEGERGRVLDYVLDRLQMTTVRAQAAGPQESPSSTVLSTRPATDIRSLTAEKQPRSAIEMVALIAFFLSEMAPESERRATVNVDAIRRYFKMAGFPLPSVLRNVLPHASSAGYLENVSRGEYRLNPVGYNLVVHGLPRSGSPGPAPQGGRPARRAPAKKTRSAGGRGR
jgi:hypothetical protein